jgi:hypothetical protein
MGAAAPFPVFSDDPRCRPHLRKCTSLFPLRLTSVQRTTPIQPPANQTQYILRSQSVVLCHGYVSKVSTSVYVVSITDESRRSHPIHLLEDITRLTNESCTSRSEERNPESPSRRPCLRSLSVPRFPRTQKSEFHLAWDLRERHSKTYSNP